jgi:NADH-quinone oxidoreductase subunit G
MPKCTIDGKEIEVPPGTTILKAAVENGIEIQYFCWHPDLPIDGNCRTCMVEIEKMPRVQIACNTVITDGMVVQTRSEKAAAAQRSALELLLINHPIDCPVCDQAGECYLQDSYMRYGLHDSKVEVEDKVRKRKVQDLGPIMLDAERCVMCTRCTRFEEHVTGTNSLQFKNRGDHKEIGTYEGRPITHGYAGNLADLCPVGALLSHDFRFKMRVWFLKEHDSVCAGCSTGCNIYVDERDGGVQRLRPRRNEAVNKSWICDIGRYSYKQIGATGRIAGARARGAAVWEGTHVDSALDILARKLEEAGSASAFLASPQASNEDLFAFRALAEAQGGLLDFRVGDPQKRIQERSDDILLREDRNPNTQGCVDLGLGKTGIAEIVAACERGAVKVLVLQGPELLRVPEYVAALGKVPFIAVMATHEGPELDRAHLVLPVSMWAEDEGTFTNYQRRVQRFRLAVPAPGEAGARWELVLRLLRKLGKPLAATTPRELFVLLAKSSPDHAGLDYRALGPEGRVIGAPPAAPAAAPAEARA